MMLVFPRAVRFFLRTFLLTEVLQYLNPPQVDRLQTKLENTEKELSDVKDQAHKVTLDKYKVGGVECSEAGFTLVVSQRVVSVLRFGAICGRSETHRMLNFLLDNNTPDGVILAGLGKSSEYSQRERRQNLRAGTKCQEQGARK